MTSSKKLFPAFVGDVVVGSLAVNDDGMIYHLTDCCEASVTGVSVTEQNPSGVACRSCYHQQPAVLAGAWMATDRLAWEKWAAPLARLFDDDGRTVDRVISMLMTEALLPELATVPGAKAWEDVVLPRITELAMERTQLIFRPRVPAAQQTVIAIVEHHDISDRIEQAPQPDAADDAAQMTGMLFADQPSTGMLF